MTSLRNGFHYALGLAALAAASLRHRIGGYTRPTDFSPDDWPTAVTHVHEIVEDWRRHLAGQDGQPYGLTGLDILELGPGATLGTGVLLVGLGARSYRAIDAFALAKRTPSEFYWVLTQTVQGPELDQARLRDAVDGLVSGRSDPITYVVDPSFDIVHGAAGRSFDLILSSAAFEHFDDIERVLGQVSEVARSGAIFLAGIDFQTHTRGVRGRDPNSIYRFSPGLYRSLSFPGQPNRQRPADYLRILEKFGWADAEIRPVDVADPGYIAWSTSGLDANFQSSSADMHVLTGFVRAVKR
ncbi:class I SAM-dependent methyltransferase [Methylobacterium gnaphalii]|uniref:Methyltransferase type 11 domain-containing protein n=1 Tax=Methylobacterium gnaphalii TaxID=1010610 RepID=A0A512JKM4_9HYPH|nr:methyltransferase domain-containing protein [Methylobacterium gnaphalii]GEP10505.1 hypothetical protein MGN01_23500 [Methylobacterium gnaphalii]GJD69268.1 hypothetical protein MMMDOFMJ_2196 [Methylobacterium gnaphalii]GLS47931.1 hypothetical protein GCM10007885_07750 [Methylobacterium gnaphalii]